MEFHKTFFDASVEEMSNGYRFDSSNHVYYCLLCGKEYVEGEIYPIGNRFFTANNAVKMHIANDHKGMFHQLIGLDRKVTGITDSQKRFLELVNKGLSDKQILDAIPEIGSLSTIRSYRFKLREKEKQAKVFSAIMNNIDTKVVFMEVHRTAKMVDERYMITDKDVEKVKKTYFDQDNRLKAWPVKEKKKLVILKEFSSLFQTGVQYTEKEVNAIIKTKYPDYALIRRFLIGYGFMDRKADGSVYWKCKE